MNIDKNKSNIIFFLPPLFKFPVCLDISFVNVVEKLWSLFNLLIFCNKAFRNMSRPSDYVFGLPVKSNSIYPEVALSVKFSVAKMTTLLDFNWNSYSYASFGVFVLYDLL